MNETALKQMESAHENFRIEVLLLSGNNDLVWLFSYFLSDRTRSVIGFNFKPDEYFIG